MKPLQTFLSESEKTCIFINIEVTICWAWNLFIFPFLRELHIAQMTVPLNYVFHIKLAPYPPLKYYCKKMGYGTSILLQQCDLKKKKKVWSLETCVCMFVCSSSHITINIHLCSLRHYTFLHAISLSFLSVFVKWSQHEWTAMFQKRVLSVMHDTF